MAAEAAETTSALGAANLRRNVIVQYWSYVLSVRECVFLRYTGRCVRVTLS